MLVISGPLSYAASKVPMRRESREVLAAMGFHALRDSLCICAKSALNFRPIALIKIFLATLFFYNPGSWGIARNAASQDAV